MPDLHLKNEDYLRKKNLPLILLRRDPQPEYPLHSHESSELVFVYRGTGKHVLPDAVREISAGDVFLIHGKTRHAYTDLKDLALCNIMFDLKEFNHPLFSLHGNFVLPSLFLLKVPDGGLHLSGEQFREALSLVKQIEEEQIAESEDSPAVIAALFMLLILTLGRYAKSAGIVKKNDHFSRIDDLVDEITGSSSAQWSRVKMAKQVGMSVSTLSRHFKDRTGISPVEYLIRVRLKKAALLLQDQELSISAISDMTGFSDSNYFCRQFRKHFGMSPGKYRIQTIKKPGISG